MACRFCVIPVSTPFYKVIETIFFDNVIFFFVSPRALSSKIFVKETMKQYRYIFIDIVGDGVVTSVPEVRTNTFQLIAQMF